MSDDQKRKKDMGQPGNGGEYTTHQRDTDTLGELTVITDTTVTSENVQAIIDALPEQHPWRLLPDRVAVIGLSISGAVADDGIRSDLHEFYAIQSAFDRHLERSGAGIDELARRVNVAAQLAEKRGVDVVTYQDPDYPAQLQELGDEQPLALWTMGNRALLAREAENMVAIIGDTEPSSYGQTISRGAALAAHEGGSLVVSGEPKGTAYDVHNKVLAANGTPVAVVAGGPDLMVKRSHFTGRRIATEGLVLSAQPVGTDATRVERERSERMLAALVGTVVVTEASLNAGSLTVARTARNLTDKHVYAYPGPFGAQNAEGSKTLIAEGTAELVLDPRNILGFD